MTDGRLRGVGVVVLGVLLMATAVPVTAQEDFPEYWGTGTNFLFVGAEEFTPVLPSASTWRYDALGFWYWQEAGAWYGIAPMRLPAGSLVTGMTIIYRDENATSGRNVEMELYRQWVAAGGTRGEELLGPAFVSSGAPGITATWVDLDPDRTVLYLDGATAQNYSLRMRMYGGSSTVSLRGVIIGWNRQVSPAPVTATFADVPVGAFAFQHIEALAASGITAGCGGGNFCPDGYVTRAQMAVFLAKALGLHWAP